ALATLKYTLDQRLAGNRAPMIFVGHTHVYEAGWNGNAPNVQDLAERRAILEEFINYALSKPEVRMRPVADIATWMNNPVARGGGGNPDRTEGGTVTATGTPCNATTETPVKAYDNLMTSASFSKWCITSAPSAATPISTEYDFAGTDAYAITSY